MKELYDQAEAANRAIKLAHKNFAEKLVKMGAKRISLYRYQWQYHYAADNGYTLAEDYDHGFVASTCNNKMLDMLANAGVKHQVVSAIRTKRGVGESLLVIG